MFRAIMDEGHNVVDCAAASLWIVDYDKKEFWTRASSGNVMDDAIVRRPFGVGIVGHVATTGNVSNVEDCTDHKSFDRTVDRDGITGFTTTSALTGPVKDESGRVVAVVQLVNKGQNRDKRASERERGGRGGGGVGTVNGGGRRWFKGLRRGSSSEASIRRTFDENDERLLEMMCHHIAVTLAAMEHKIPTE